MQTFVIVVHLMIVLAMIGVVLLQKSEGGGFGIGSGGGFMSSRGTANVLTRTTAILAAGFFATSLVLSILAGLHRKPNSILHRRDAPAALRARPRRRSAPGGGGVLDQLRQQEQQPAAPPGAAVAVRKGHQGPGNRPFGFVGACPDDKRSGLRENLAEPFKLFR